MLVVSSTITKTHSVEYSIWSIILACSKQTNNNDLPLSKNGGSGRYMIVTSEEAE